MSVEHDGVEEALEGMLRVGLTAAGRMAEVLARTREQAARDAQAASEAQAREVGQRLAAERAAARSQLAPVHRSEWWDAARPDDIAAVWETADTWAQLDPIAGQAADRIRGEVRDRYGIDVSDPGGDPAAVRAALERRDAAERGADRHRETARDDQTAAAVLLAAADAADRAAAQDNTANGPGATAADNEPAEELGGDPRRGRSLEDAAADSYDTADRRRALAESLDGVADGEAVAARVTADTAQAKPARQAVVSRPRQAPRARRSQSTAPIRERQTGLDR